MPFMTVFSFRKKIDYKNLSNYHGESIKYA